MLLPSARLESPAAGTESRAAKAPGPPATSGARSKTKWAAPRSRMVRSVAVIWLALPASSSRRTCERSGCVSSSSAA